MKHPLFTLFVVAMATTSCMKEATCTCKTAGGTVMTTQTQKSTSRNEMEKFKNDCKAFIHEDTVNGVVVPTNPCEVS